MSGRKCQAENHSHARNPCHRRSSELKTSLKCLLFLTCRRGEAYRPPGLALNPQCYEEEHEREHSGVSPLLPKNCSNRNALGASNVGDPEMNAHNNPTGQPFPARTHTHTHTHTHTRTHTHTHTYTHTHTHTRTHTRTRAHTCTCTHTHTHAHAHTHTHTQSQSRSLSHLPPPYHSATQTSELLNASAAVGSSLSKFLLFISCLGSVMLWYLIFAQLTAICHPTLPCPPCFTSAAGHSSSSTPATSFSHPNSGGGSHKARHRRTGSEASNKHHHHHRAQPLQAIAAHTATKQVGRAHHLAPLSVRISVEASLCSNNIQELTEDVKPCRRRPLFRMLTRKRLPLN